LIAIVCGAREGVDAELLYRTLDDFHKVYTLTFIIEGGANGCDTQARYWAHSARVPCATIDAHWNTLGKVAGPIRSGWMLRLKPDVVIAFPGGKGTADMVRQAKAAGVEVVEVTQGE